MNATWWLGWIKGRKDQEDELRGLGVKGPMGWHPDQRVYDPDDYDSLPGTFQGCTCDKETMRRLVLHYEGFIPGTFTGVFIPETFTEVDADWEQLPREHQKFWDWKRGKNDQVT